MYNVYTTYSVGCMLRNLNFASVRNGRLVAFRFKLVKLLHVYVSALYS